MNGRGKSDRLIRPKTPSNKVSGAPESAEKGEGRSLAEGNPDWQDRDRTQDREALQNALVRIRQATERDRTTRLTTLWHHVYDPRRLREAYFSLSRNAAPGVDGKTWQEYGRDLEANLADLSGRLKRGAYRAKPVERTWVPKQDGRKRPIGVPTLEDKIVQRSAAEVLGTVYEQEFLGFSYGFRPGRSQHDALDALYVGITQRKVNWVIDADIRGFFDAIDHEWMMKFVEHRIADQRVHRHIKKWLNAGVLEDGRKHHPRNGTPQGGSISPLLANIYLHYAFDVWVHSWRKKYATGDVIVVRYADDIVMGFQSRRDAERFREAMERRLSKFGLELHPDKTRLIEFGRFAADNRKGRGDRKPDTFDFLGFTHICGKTRKGRFKLVRHTIASRMTSTLHRIKAALRRAMHAPVDQVGRWLQQVMRGYYRYFAVPDNSHRLRAFHQAVYRLWRQVLRRRSQRGRVNTAWYNRLTAQWLPRPRVLHPYPNQRLRV